jgi:CheY-like chemotaxis protein
MGSPTDPLSQDPLTNVAVKQLLETLIMDEENGRSQGRILVVDDESSVRAVAEQVLKLAGHAVQTAENGFEALECLESGARFDLLLLDVSMPRMDGMELLSELVKKEIDIPILLMSGHAEQEIQKAAEEGLVKGIIGKPFGIQDLRKAVDDLLGEPD